MENRRVVVVGMGTIHALGDTPEKLWKAIIEGKNGFSSLDTNTFSKFPTRIAAAVSDFDLNRYLDSKEAKVWDRFAIFGVWAALQAWEDAGFSISIPAGDRTGVWLGSGIGGMGTLLRANDSISKGESWRSSPYTVPMMIVNIAAGLTSIRIGASGPCISPVTACATGNNALGEAFLSIKSGQVDRAIAGGCEAPLIPAAFSGFNSMKAMSVRNDTPEQACTPFALGRDGFLMGEGAGVLVLEDYESAKSRKAKILAEIVGFGVTADAYHLTSPHPEGRGAAKAMEQATLMAGWTPDQVDYINAHGTGTQLGDIAETKAIHRFLGESAYKVSVSSTKGATGHLFGAAGGLEAILCVKALINGFIPPTLGLYKPDPECDLDYVPLVARKKSIQRILSNGFGFGGHNAVIALQKIL